MKRFAFLLPLIALTACASGGSALLETTKQLYGSASTAPTPPSNPQLSYLRVVIDGQEVFLALGYVDATPDGPTEVWYSGDGEVLRLRHGRIVGTSGLLTDWRAVRHSIEPAWPAKLEVAAGTPNSVSYTRERDLMPGYRFGIRDLLTRAPAQAPDKHHLTQHAAHSLHWFEEHSVTTPSAQGLPPARFALAHVDGQAHVVYSEQCLTHSVCLSIEQWAPSPTTAATASNERP